MAAAGSQNSVSKPSLYLQNMDEVRKVFDRFDSDGDGRISPDELTSVLKALGSDVSQEEVTRVMEQIDTDENGRINLQEFAAFCSGDADPNRGGGEKELREAFELYDQDHDGKISAAELHQILTRIGEGRSLEECAVMIKSVDSSGDGFVSLDEFRKMMTNKK